MPAVKRDVPLKISTPIVPANNPKMMETKFFSLSSDPMVETATKPIKANKKYSGSPRLIANAVRGLEKKINTNAPNKPPIVEAVKQALFPGNETVPSDSHLITWRRP